MRKGWKPRRMWEEAYHKEAQLPTMYESKDGLHKAKVTALICTMNEAENLGYVLPRIPAWVDEVLLVDGHSSDGTTEVAKQLRPDILVLLQPGKGKGLAIRHGVAQAQGEIVVTLDADGTTNPEDMERFVHPLFEGYDFVKGTRLTQGRPPKMPLHRWFGNWLLAATANLLFATRYTDICSGYNAFWKQHFSKLDLNYAGSEMEQEMLVQLRDKKLRVAEVFHFDAGRIAGVSQTETIPADAIKGLLDLWVIVKERFRARK